MSHVQTLKISCNAYAVIKSIIWPAVPRKNLFRVVEAIDLFIITNKTNPMQPMIIHLNMTANNTFIFPWTSEIIHQKITIVFQERSIMNLHNCVITSCLTLKKILFHVWNYHTYMYITYIHVHTLHFFVWGPFFVERIMNYMHNVLKFQQ